MGNTWVMLFVALRFDSLDELKDWFRSVVRFPEVLTPGEIDEMVSALKPEERDEARRFLEIYSRESRRELRRFSEAMERGGSFELE